MGGFSGKKFTSLLSVSFPVINPRAQAYEPYLNDLNFYLKFLSFLDQERKFTEIAGEIYDLLQDGKGVKEKEYHGVIDRLVWEIKKIITEMMMDLKSYGSTERAYEIEKFIKHDKLGAIYGLLMEHHKEQNTKLETYRKILEFFDSVTVFNNLAGSIYAKINVPKYVSDRDFGMIEKSLKKEISMMIGKRVEELRTSSLGREADKVEEYLSKGDLENAYLTINGIKNVNKIEGEKVDIYGFMDRYMNTLSLVSTLERGGVDVSDIKWKIVELLGINIMGIPNGKMIIVDDRCGNFACFLSLFLGRVGMPYTFFSTSGIGDYWITNVDAKNKINPNLQASDIGELIIKAKNIVVIEDVNYLIRNNKFSEVYRFLYYIKNNAESQIIVTVNMKTLTDKEQARLRGIANLIMEVDYPLNVCSSNVVAISNRPQHGALLLSKEIVDDFEGDVYMIADFGGDKYLHPQRLDFEILDRISEYIEKGDIVIDALDMLIDENSIEKIYLWLKFLKDIAKRSGNRIFIVTKDLIESEREYLRPLVDFDLLFMADIEMNKLKLMQKGISKIKRTVEKRIEKECLYNIQIIKNRYQQYRGYLSDFNEDIERISKISTYDRRCLLFTAPVRREIEHRIEEIERMVTEFQEREREINHALPILRVYVDVTELENCIGNSRALLSSGHYEAALEKIKGCAEQMALSSRKAIATAWDIRNEILCVDYLLPPYYRDKVNEFEGEQEKLKDFTLLYISLKNLIKRRMEMEYSRLKEYALVSGLEFFDYSSVVDGKYCEYRRFRDDFMHKFNETKQHLIDEIKRKIIPAYEFLEERGYNLQINTEKINSVNDLDEILDVENRVSHHLIRYVDNYISKIREICSLCVESTNFDYEVFRADPLNNIASLKLTVHTLDEKLVEEEKELMKVTEEIRSYYSAFKKYGVKFEEKYPRNLKDGKRIQEEVERIAETVIPDIQVSLSMWKIDESHTITLILIIKNTVPYPAKNVTLEFHGAFSQRIDIGEMEGKANTEVRVTSEVRDAGNSINIDVIYESLSDKMINKFVSFDINLRGYTSASANGNERCALCRGKIFRDTDMVVCSGCGAVYHYKCAERIGKCKVCGQTFFFS